MGGLYEIILEYTKQRERIEKRRAYRLKRKTKLQSEGKHIDEATPKQKYFNE